MSVGNLIASRAASASRNGSRAMYDHADGLRRRGKRVIHLTGAPPGPPPSHVLEAAARAVYENGRAPSNGLLELREAIRAKLHRENGIVADPGTDVLVTHGGMQALHAAMTAILDPGDEVIFVAPCFYFYGIAELLGARSVYVPCAEVEGFRVDPRRIAAAVSARTKLLVLNTPVNPTGVVIPSEDLAAILSLAQARNFLILSDESYEKLVFDGRSHVSIGALEQHPERVLTVHSFTKSYAMQGWRVGYVASAAPLVGAIRKVLEYTILSGNYVAQQAAIAALTGPQEWVAEIGRQVDANRQLVLRGFCEMGPVTFVPPAGGPNIYLNVTGLGGSCSEVAAWLLEEHGVPTVSGDAFKVPGYLRFSFAGDRQNLEVAIAAVQAAVSHRRREGSPAAVKVSR